MVQRPTPSRHKRYVWSATVGHTRGTTTCLVGRVSSVGLATRFDPDGLGIAFQWWRDFPHPSWPLLWPTQHSVQRVRGLLPGDRAAGPWRWPFTPSSAEVKEIVALYVYSPSGPVLGWIWPLNLCMCVAIAVAQWLRCCATNRKVAGSIPDGVIGNFHWHNPSERTMALVSTQPLTEMSTRSISWG